MLWVRYLRIDFLTHYGQKIYCPVSLLRVHGTTMMEEYKKEEEEEEEYMSSGETSSSDFETLNNTEIDLIDNLLQQKTSSETSNNGSGSSNGDVGAKELHVTRDESKSTDSS